MLEINYDCIIDESKTKDVAEEVVALLKKDFEVVEKVEWNEASFDGWIKEDEEMDENTLWDILWEDIIPYDERENKWKIHVYVPPEIANVAWGVSIFAK